MKLHRSLIAIIALCSASTALAAIPTLAQFNALMKAECQSPAVEAQNLVCAVDPEDAEAVKCTYRLTDPEGPVEDNEAVLAIVDKGWLWLDGGTMCLQN